MTRRLVLSYLAITVVVLVLLEVPLAIFFQQREENRLTVDTERDATVLATFYEDALERSTPADPAPADDYTGRTGARVVVVDSAGISIVDTGGDPPRDFSTRPEIATALTGTRASGTRDSATLGTELLYVAVPVASGGTVHGALRLTLDAHEVSERITRFRIGLAAIAAVVLIVIGAAGWFIARSVTEPVRRLQAAATRFAGGDLTPTTPSDRAPPEIVDLERSLNTMALRLDELLQRQRAFVADASHQLRTPLTALRLRLENALSATSPGPAGAGSTGTAVDVAELDRAIEETDRLSALVDDLLQLARAERQSTPVATDLVGLGRDRVDTWGAVADERAVTVEFASADGRADVLAVSGAIEQILDNLLDNALRVAPAGSTITVAIRQVGERWELRVADEGPGLTDDQRTRATERFWRGTGTGDGTGLGLAIVAALASASGGDFVLEANSPTGLIAVATFVGVAN